MTTPLIAVAHGSRDTRSAATIHALTDLVRARHADLDVRTAFLDLSSPRLDDVLDAVHGEGHREAVVVPLLLGHAFHARVDVPGIVSEIRRHRPFFHVHVASVLGPDGRLEDAAWGRLAETGVDLDDPALGVLLAGAGSSHQPANRLVADVAGRWGGRAPWAGASAAFAAAAAPDVPAAVAALRARGARRFALASWFLAPGLLPDRVVTALHEHTTEPAVAAPMGAAPEVADLVADRYRAAVAPSHPTQRQA
ncbi:sirohydrochlorin chelatase [Allosaccharopolyspora coralli]|uniref:Sirohydrochlorin chelatase n=1 Tax=Allosaccharopolyspora coralli TaxID=2665642 RepID=A0A5Q3Q3T2_9PSEU|nr:sirohydrochlorin chelatase [Allosaccharopolyspora coralli]QGK69268.1 sirohydrochlorin chelatase [Allosaccharopolyspora coralli]